MENASPVRLPFFFVSNAPVVFVSVNGFDPAPFIVDTGASSNVISKTYAKKLNASIVSNTNFMASSSAGDIPTNWSLSTFDIGGLKVKNVPALVLDLPIDNIAGVLSPHTVFSQDMIEFNFQSQELIISSSSKSEKNDELVTLPLIMAESNPVMVVALDSISPRPILLDTGADTTSIFTSIGDVEKYLVDAKEQTSTSAGGRTTRSWTSPLDLEASSGKLNWNMTTPVFVENISKPVSHEMTHQGLLGADFLIGRRIIIDNKNRVLKISKDARLLPWETNESTTYEVTGVSHKGPISVTETVVKRDGGTVSIEVKIDHPGNPAIFKFEMDDTWETRGTWLITRPAKRFWEISGGKDIEKDVWYHRTKMAPSI